MKKNKWYLKCDIKKYFYSINHETLLNILKKQIIDEQLNQLIKKIITNGGEQGKGLPIGNLTSQFFANLYLNELDFYIKQELRQKYYIRYMDDFVIFANDKEILKKIKTNISKYLQNNLKLELKENSVINQQLNGLGFLGVRIYPNLIRIKNENLKRSIKKVLCKHKLMKKEEITENDYVRSIDSVFGNLCKYNTYKLRVKIMGNYHERL